ncbi:M20/M25/M40 family metallo-hydrolase [Pseudoxanthomonas sp. LH2527]|uniref:M20/M25/M40 family metallo-hydrolase n=1 Tax=Pseudoxanthomonas sp. LH2527 TaxID=2923249 RepID=UPI001F12F95B|nr:M20/M25/M40 family metallo-hydrolase [Pseudoxanthomonas sp. LH2527]MCH6485041.1 M20/M25/M40 family metallo-hydrolase [Pseudoxanthomonas sp. LH2527]
MKPIILGPTTFLFSLLILTVLLRADSSRAVQAAAGSSPAGAWKTSREAGAPRASAVRNVAVPALTPTAQSAASSPTDPFAPVYIVTSRDTWQGIRGLGREAVTQHDSTGQPLVIAETRADRLGAISEHVHVNERRCGGYFAFPTRAQAEAFVQADRARQAMATSMLAGYTLDNQATVNRWLPQVQEQRLYDTINHLSGYRNRYFASSHGKTSAEWIRTHWQSLAAGRSDITTELFTACSNCGTQPSVILTIPGWDLPNEVVVLGAHLDSINGSNPYDPNQHAPGADDDASGIATLTETLRIALADGWQPRRTVKFMGYAAEEVGLRGSNAIAQAFRASGVNVVSVLQVDMTNYKAGAVTDMKLISDYSNTELKAFFITLFDTYLAPMGLTRGSVACGYACSDHASWTNAGYPAAMMFEAGDPNGSFRYIHTPYDTLATMGESAQHSVKFTQFALAYLGETAKTRGRVTGGPAQVLVMP